MTTSITLAAAIDTAPRQNNRTTASSSAATSATKSPSRTFQRVRLEQAFRQHFIAQLELVEMDREGLARSIRQRLRQEIDFITNPLFTERRAETLILGDSLLGTGLPEQPAKATRVPDLPTHLARLCETRLLRPEEESVLFQRMNYLRFRAAQYQSRLHPERSTAFCLARVGALLAAADWYRDQIVQSNMRLVISIVKKFVNSCNAFDDLLSDGIVALMRAVDKFDYDRGFRFSTYATQVVRRNAYRTVVLRQKERAKVNCSLQEAGVDVSDEARISSMTEQRWHTLRARLTLMLDHLDRREKLIIRARFSLGGHRRVQTLQKLAERLGVSKERVRQLEKRAMDKLRDMALDCGAMAVLEDEG
jgi:RNA polymerase primary sigma factor